MEVAPNMPTPEHLFRQMATELWETPDIRKRTIVVSPYYGAYGPAGVVICLNGSPPRGTILAPLGYPNDPVVYFSGYKSRTYRLQYSGRDGGPDHSRHWVIGNFLKSLGIEKRTEHDWPIEIKGEVEEMGRKSEIK